jgi:uncharacterized membrane-anchored protein YhcB (DUF1043 family)
MSAQLLLWLGLAGLALMIGLMVAVAVARSLDGSSKRSQQQFADKMSELAQRAAKETKGQIGVPGSLSKVFASMAEATSDKAKGQKEKATRNPMNEAITGLTVVGVIIAIVVGIVAGDG